ncbi:hypothetical protein [Amycolatopsis sp. NPDC004378]
MTDAHRLLAFLREHPAATVTERAGSCTKWQLTGSTWRATVVVEPGRWLGLEFEAREPATGKRATYAIDTDLYDISREDQREFADEIERDIVEFLGNLGKGALLRGNTGTRFVLVFPLAGAYVRVVQGRFMTSASTHPVLPDGDYVPVD